jgi:hypothetical protein
VIFSGFKVSVFKMEFIAMEFIAGNKEEFIPIATGINGFVTLDNDKGVGFVIGTLSATDPDTDTTTNALTFTTDSADFEIVQNH